MNPIRIVTCFLIAATLAACGEEPGDGAHDAALRLDDTTGVSRQAIVGGRACDPQEFPETGRVNFRHESLCTGTLVAPDTVLTAAHCVIPIARLSKRFLPPEHLMFTPDDGVERDQAAFVARDYVIDPEYLTAEPCIAPRTREEHRACRQVLTTCGTFHDADAYSKCLSTLPQAVRVAIGIAGPGNLHDVALIFLRQPVPNASVAQLLSAAHAERLHPQAPVEITGYGIRTPLPTGDVDAESIAKHWAFTALGDVGTHEVVTLPAPAPHACHGDSGGPLFLSEVNGERTQIGIASRIDNWRPASGCASGLVYSRVDTNLPWIQARMQDACEDGTRVSCEEPRIATPPPTPPEEYGDEGCAATPPVWGTLAFLLLLLGRSLSLKGLYSSLARAR